MSHLLTMPKVVESVRSMGVEEPPVSLQLPVNFSRPAEILNFVAQRRAG